MLNLEGARWVIRDEGREDALVEGLMKDALDPGRRDALVDGLTDAALDDGLMDALEEGRLGRLMGGRLDALEAGRRMDKLETGRPRGVLSFESNGYMASIDSDTMSRLRKRFWIWVSAGVSKVVVTSKQVRV